MARKKLRSQAEVEQALALALERIHYKMPQYAKNNLTARIQTLEWVLGDPQMDDIILPTRTD